MPAVSILIKPCSSNCNMNCKYCFYKKLCSTREMFSKGKMTEETLRVLIKNACDYAENTVSFAFQGGEPMLAGLEFYEKAVELQKENQRKNLIVENTIQTNGLLIDDKWARFFAANDFLVGVSLDGPKKMHDEYRKDADGNPTFYKVMEGIALLRKYGVRFNVSMVITEKASHHAEYLYNFCKRNRFPFVQLIPCTGDSWRCKNSHKAAENEFSVRPESYGGFLTKMFDMWYPDFCAGNDMEIRTFSNLAQLAAGFPAEECGMNGMCGGYFAVEADGSVYPCDFYCMEKYCIGTAEQPFAELKESKKAEGFIKESCEKCMKCRKCPYYRLCRGGCRYWREPDSRLNYLCAGYYGFFENCSSRIEALGEMILRNRNHFL